MMPELLRALQKVKTADEKALEVIDIIDNLGMCDIRMVILECAKAGRFGDLRAMGSWVPFLIACHNESIGIKKSREETMRRFGDFEEFGAVKGTPVEKWMKEQH